MDEGNKRLLTKARERYLKVQSEEEKLECVNFIIQAVHRIEPSSNLLYKYIKAYVAHYIRASFDRAYQYDVVLFDKLTQHFRLLSFREQSRLYLFAMYQLRQVGCFELVEECERRLAEVEHLRNKEVLSQPGSLAVKTSTLIRMLLSTTSATPQRFLFFVLLYLGVVCVVFMPAWKPEYALFEINSGANLDGIFLNLAAALEFVFGVTDISITALNIWGAVLLSLIKLGGAIPTLVFFKNMFQKKAIGR